MREISPFSLIYVITVTVANTIILVLTIITGPKYPYYFFTLWAYYANSFYLISVLICDISSYFFRSEILDTFNLFMRNHYSKYSIPLSYTVTILFWLLVFLGNQFLKWETQPDKVFFEIYLHGIMSFVLLFEMLQNDSKKKQTSSFLDIIILSIIILLYCITITIGKYAQNFNPYQFMKFASPKQLITPLFLFEVFAINSYQLHLFFINLKAKYLSQEHEFKDLYNAGRSGDNLIPN